MQELKINPTFRDLIPPLAPYELEALEAELRHWARAYAPIITWNGTIVDGHHRYEICKKYNLPFKTISVEEKYGVKFKTERDARKWIIINQFSRRNMTDFVRGELVLAYEDELKDEAEENQKATQFKEKSTVWQNFATPSPKSQKERDESRVDANLGKKAGISREQVRKIKKLKEDGVCTDKEIKQLREGNVKISKKFTEKRREKQVEDLKDIEFPKGKYRVIYADPPWEYEPSKGPGGGDAEDEYPTLSFEDICNLPVQDITDETAVLFLWVTTPLIQKGLTVMKSWGFEYKTLFTWDKVRSFFGHYNAVAQEFLLIGTKGSCLPDCNTLPHSVVRIEKGRHSEKPEEFRHLIESMYKYGNKVELFARKKTAGWEVYGNECV